MLTTPLTLLPNATLETGSASDRQPCQTTPLPPPPPPSSPKVCISQETPRKVFAHIASRYISEGLSLLGDQDQQHEGDSEDSESEFIEALKEVPWEPLKGMDQGDEEAEVGNIGSVDGRRLTSGLQLYPDFVQAEKKAAARNFSPLRFGWLEAILGRAGLGLPSVLKRLEFYGAVLFKRWHLLLPPPK